jgi:hypothetical protein
MACARMGQDAEHWREPSDLIREEGPAVLTNPSALAGQHCFAEPGTASRSLR